MGEVKWSLVGEHNMHNGLMAIAAARHVGVAPADAANALGSFINARRRLELRGEANGVTVYDDFAITRRRFWQRWRRCVAKLVVRRALLPYWNRALIP